MKIQRNKIPLPKLEILVRTIHAVHSPIVSQSETIRRAPVSRITTDHLQIATKSVSWTLSVQAIKPVYEIIV